MKNINKHYKTNKESGQWVFMNRNYMAKFKRVRYHLGEQLVTMSVGFNNVENAPGTKTVSLDQFF